MADFGFVGPSYEAPSIYQDAQECINYYPEIDPLKPQGSTGVIALYPTPGLTKKLQFPIEGEVRAMFPLHGTDPEIFIAVCFDRVYKVDATYTATQIGTLSTSTGPVQISYNRTIADGIIAYIVDGVDRY